MRARILVLVALCALTAVAAVPAAEAAPPNIPPGNTGCGYFHWHNGNVAQGQTPGYHYHHCF